MKQLPVIAAIPNYNMADSLESLLGQLAEQNYDRIYVLDDASTDRSREVVLQFEPKVRWIGGTENLGPGGNRNRILKAHTDNCIIHFLDADVRLLSTDIVETARQMMHDPNTGFVGGLVLEHGRQSIWNFGQYPNFHENIAGTLQHTIGSLQGTGSWWQRGLRKLMRPFLSGRPDLAMPPRRQTVFWTLEANLLIERDRLAALGSFDATIREHDIMTPAYYARQQKLHLYFDPAIAVEHPSIKFSTKRIIRRIKIARYLRRKFGMSLWT